MHLTTIIVAFIGSALAAPVTQPQDAGLVPGLTELVSGVGETAVLTTNNVSHASLLKHPKRLETKAYLKIHGKINKRQGSGLVPKLSDLLNGVVLGEALDGLVKRQGFLEELRELADKVPFVEMPDMGGKQTEGGVHALNEKRQLLEGLRELADKVPFVEMPSMEEDGM